MYTNPPKKTTTNIYFKGENLNKTYVLRQLFFSNELFESQNKVFKAKRVNHQLSSLSSPQ